MKSNLFGFLSLIDKQDFGAIDNLSAEEKKSLSPLIIQRWLSGTSSTFQIKMINTIVNPLIFPLSKYQDLLFKLMIVCSDEKIKQYKWIKQEGKIKKNPITLSVIQQYYNCNLRESEMYVGTLKKDDIIEMAELLGVEQSILDKLKKEYA